MLAYVVLFLPLAVGAVRSSVALCPPRLEEVARSLGQRPVEVLRRVTIPLAAPGVAAGGALVLLTTMKELPATLLLRPTGVDTLATELWTQTSNAAFAAAAPYAAALVLVAAVPTALLTRWTGGRGERAADRGPAQGVRDHRGAARSRPGGAPGFPDGRARTLGLRQDHPAARGRRLRARRRREGAAGGPGGLRSPDAPATRAARGRRRPAGGRAVPAPRRRGQRRLRAAGRAGPAAASG